MGIDLGNFAHFCPFDLLSNLTIEFDFLLESLYPMEFLNHKHFGKSIPVNKRGEINPNGSYIEANICNVSFSFSMFTEIGYFYDK